jgi:FAD:protein FMN transferase
MEAGRTARDVMDGWESGRSGTVVHADRIVHVEHVWSTAVSVTLTGTSGREADAQAAVETCRRLFAQVDETFSAFRPLSEVSRFRAGLLDASHHSAAFDEVMAECRRVRHATRGAFDPWAVLGGYDPSGYVKGWAAGRAADLLSAAGFADHLVNAGGDICARGDEVPGSGAGWPVGILNPHAPGEVVEVVRLTNQSMATSGRYERGDHVIDPRTGAPARGVDSATVVGPDPGFADACASAVLVDGSASIAWFAGLGPQWSFHLVVGQEAFCFGAAFEEQA